jgi:excisionase family DNA binding protein
MSGVNASMLEENAVTLALSDLPMLATSKQAAEVMGVTEPQLRNLIHEQRLAYVRVGKRRLIPRNAIEAFITENTVQPSCQDETQGQGSHSSTSGVAITSPGPKAAVAGSALRARQIAHRLKLRSPSSSTSEPARLAPVIRLKS